MINTNGFEEEVWKDVPGYGGWYRVSDFGRVQSCFNIGYRDRYAQRGEWKDLSLKSLSSGYFVVNLTNPISRKPRTYQIHTLLWITFNGPVPETMTIDHANRNRIDNRLNNLRLSSRSGQGANRTKLVGCFSIYKGVTKAKSKSKPWCAKIRVNYKHIFLGHFLTELDAAKAYNDAARKYFGEFANLNQIPSEVQ